METLLRRIDNYALDVKTDRRVDKASSKTFQLNFVTSFPFIIGGNFFAKRWYKCTVTYFLVKKVICLFV